MNVESMTALPMQLKQASPLCMFQLQLIEIRPLPSLSTGIITEKAVSSFSLWPTLHSYSFLYSEGWVANLVHKRLLFTGFIYRWAGATVPQKQEPGLHGFPFNVQRTQEQILPILARPELRPEATLPFMSLWGKKTCFCGIPLPLCSA